MAFVVVESSRHGGYRRASSGACRLMLVKAGRPDDRTYAVQISLSVEAMNMMRWMIGDRVTVAFDDADPLLVLICLTKSGGRTISSPKGKADIGKTGERGFVKFTMPPSFSFKPGDAFECLSPTEGHGGLVLQFQ